MLVLHLPLLQDWSLPIFSLYSQEMSGIFIWHLQCCPNSHLTFYELGDSLGSVKMLGSLKLAHCMLGYQLMNSWLLQKAVSNFRQCFFILSSFSSWFLRKCWSDKIYFLIIKSESLWAFSRAFLNPFQFFLILEYKSYQQINLKYKTLLLSNYNQGLPR